ncbi:hypothetical protein PIB30_014878 [Stylosanthes scabra]|uniref:Uncharacterized protein n=1 Tax=Stylosanthes scabra TaxID=79078 RepID=A0ABU6T6J3_9FABA|nr:hypothetical protein [Stylosanthes scabra]
MVSATMVVMVILVLLTGMAASNDNQTQALKGCQSSCGDIQIPYPFGVGNSLDTGKNCSLSRKFNLVCKNSTLYRVSIPIITINITKGQVDMMISISKTCYVKDYGKSITLGNEPWLRSTYTISSADNKFISVGCDTYGYLNSFFDGATYSTGCLTRCFRESTMITDGKCWGIGCCQVDIPAGMRNNTVQAFSFENFNRSLSFNNCSYAFVAKNGNYTFSKDHLENLPYKRMAVVFDWSVGNETCEDSFKSGTNVCKGNSNCEKSETGNGYLCKCKEGYEGNPYHPIGCIDIDECRIGKHDCISEDNCINTIGSYKCFCPKGQIGNGTKEQGACRHQNLLPKVVIGTSAGTIALVVATSLFILTQHKRKHIQLKEKFFKQNGGLMLLQQLSAREESSSVTQIFTSEELRKATNNYDENLILGRGGYGTVFKGFLDDNRVVAVKKSRIIDQSQTEQFINEVIVLSQINHRNIVKLLGCCLEEEVPLLVYEFVNNGTLFDLIHNQNSAKNLLTWKTRLRIAAEAAGALSYLHSAASIPIIHRDVKSANILLDDTLTAKVSDFGASRLVPLDQEALATMVQGTIGYLDPEYMQTSQLTEKSDVYSFGVVLVELLTSEKPLSFDRTEEKRSLALYFLSYLKEDRLFEILQVDLLSEENKQEIEEVAILAAKCLRLNGDERPSMKEVAIELEGLRLMQRHPWINENKNLEETYCLLPKSSSKTYEWGDSSCHRNDAYDSITDQVLISFDDGR